MAPGLNFKIENTHGIINMIECRDFLNDPMFFGS